MAKQNFKNVRNMEIKDRIARINEASASDDETPVSQPNEEQPSNPVNLNTQEPVIMADKAPQLAGQNRTQAIEKSAAATQNIYGDTL